MVPDNSPATGLLGDDDPPVVEIIRERALYPVLLLCDHASNGVPAALDGLGLPPAELLRHIAWDNGAAPVTRLLSERFGATAILGGYSRLVVDCNRPPDHATFIARESDGVMIPGNMEITTEEARRRKEEIFDPYHATIARQIARRRERGIVPALIAIHSFTDEMGGVWRPWHVSVLWDRDPRIPLPLIRNLSADPALTVGDNQPYSGREHYGHTIETHGTAAGLPNVLIEMREDQLRDRAGIERLAGIVGDALAPILDDPRLYREEHH